MEIELHNRLSIGPAIGWGLYNIDEEFDYGEFIVYLLVISIHFRWFK